MLIIKKATTRADLYDGVWFASQDPSNSEGNQRSLFLANPGMMMMIGLMMGKPVIIQRTQGT
jgi:hypothetical protein